MAREVMNNTNYTNSIDVWALGMIWYEITTKKTFFEGKNVFIN